jgi:predicted nucleic acid-binding protein
MGQQRIQLRRHELTINPVIYSELSLALDEPDKLDSAIDAMELVFRDIPPPARFLAGRAYLAYRRTGDAEANGLGDFFIDAHAAVAGFGILTRDTHRNRNCFPSVPRIAPEGAAARRRATPTTKED